MPILHSSLIPKLSAMFDLSVFFANEQFHANLFCPAEPIWETLKRLSIYLADLCNGPSQIKGQLHPSANVAPEGVILEENSYVDAGALILGPTYIGRNTFIGHSALIRPNTLIGEECVIGHSTEVKDSVIFPQSRAAHFNFIGDSIIGSSVNLGGGTIISNFEFNDPDQHKPIRIKKGRDTFDTNLRKMGAIVGDGTKTGANSVLSPGSLIARNVTVFPGAVVRKGFTEANTIITIDYYNSKRGSLS